MFYYSSSVTRDITPNKQWGKKKIQSTAKIVLGIIFNQQFKSKAMKAVHSKPFTQIKRFKTPE